MILTVCILRMCDAEQPEDSVATEPGTSLNVVYKWRNRYQSSVRGGNQGL